MHYYVSRVVRVGALPASCPRCGGGRLKEDAVLATAGPSERDAGYAPSALCLSCETLAVAAPAGGVVGIHHSAGNQATVRGQG